MKRNLPILFLPLVTISCGIFLGENPRSFVYQDESGKISFMLSENRLPLTEMRSLIVKSTSNYPLRGTDCADAELKKFSEKVWSEIAKRDDLAGINSATMMLEKESVQGVPKYCEFGYSREKKGGWIQD